MRGERRSAFENRREECFAKGLSFFLFGWVFRFPPVRERERGRLGEDHQNSNRITETEEEMMMIRSWIYRGRNGGYPSSHLKAAE